MRSQTAEKFIFAVLFDTLITNVAVFQVGQGEICNSDPPLKDTAFFPNNSPKSYIQLYQCRWDPQFAILISSLQPDKNIKLYKPTTVVPVENDDSSNDCPIISDNVSVVLYLLNQDVKDNVGVWMFLQTVEENSVWGKNITFSNSGCSKPKDLFKNVLKCEQDFEWYQSDHSIVNEYYLLSKSISTTTSTITSTALPTSTSPSQSTQTRPTNYGSNSTTTSTGSLPLPTTSFFISNCPDTDDSTKLAIGLGLGLSLGISLLIAIIIIILLCIQLSLAKHEKRNNSDAYSTISPNSCNASPSGATQEPQLSADYSSISPNSTINKSTFNRKTLYAPSSTYDQPYGNGNGNYASIPPANGNSSSPQQKQTAPSVLYAIVNKVKPKRNVSKTSRTLANPNDDVVIVDNDLYTTETGNNS